MNHEDLKNRIIARHNEVIDKARALFPSYAAISAPSVYFFETGKAAGLAHGNNRIGYNLHIFAQDADRFINDTIPHEIAHIVCFQLGLDRGHGAKWKRVCRLLGGNGQRCFAGEGIAPKMIRVRKKYEYKATCGTVVEVSDVMHGKIQRGATSYILKTTKGRILAAGYTGKAA